MSTTDLPPCWRELHDVLDAGIDRVILFGPPGTGKTFAGLNLGDTDAGSWRLTCTEDMTTADVSGMWKPNGATWSWHNGAVINAWEGDGFRGGRIVADEIDRAGGDVYSTLLAMFDSEGSASFRNPETGRIVRPRPGFSVVMTTNVEDLRDLPDALVDRFPVAIRINEPHPQALDALPRDLRNYARRMADAGQRRISLRKFHAYAKLRASLGDERAAQIIFRADAPAFLDAIAIDRVAA